MLPKIDYDLKTLRGDLFGGVTAAVVGLPVSLAFGVASGLGAVAGLYGAIAVGFFAAVFGGTRSQISGPTGPMAVAVAVIVTTHADNLAAAFTIVIMAGLLQIVLGVARIGRFRRLYAVFRHIRIHVRHRHNHHPLTDPAFPGHVRCGGRTDGGGPSLAGCD